MCTRYAIAVGVSSVEKEFGAEFTFAYQPVFNAGFGMDLPVIADPDNRIRKMRWGLVPRWSATSGVRYHNVNAWAGDVVSSKLYRVPLRKRRCLVPANCFYIWVTAAQGARVPYAVYFSGQRTFSMAGLWDEWVDRHEGRCLRTFSIITTRACKRLRPFSRTMPVILSPSRRTTYLKADVPLHRITSMLRPLETDQLNLYPVSPQINDCCAEGRSLVQPVGQRIYKEYRYENRVDLKLKGMG